MNAYTDESARITSFKNWSCSYVKPCELARAGFYSINDDDCVRCAFCAISINKWEKGDDPMKEHKKWSPNCSIFNEGCGYDVCGIYEYLPNSFPENYLNNNTQFEKKISTGVTDQSDLNRFNITSCIIL